MNLGRGLLQEFVPANENPLGLIGLSPQILRLNLTTDELYSAARRLAKSLLATVHEDRVAQTPRTKHLQFRFSQAMQALKTRETFELALAEFRSEINHDDSEYERLRRDTERLQLRVVKLEDEIADKQRKVKTMQRSVGSSKQRLVTIEADATKRITMMASEVQEARTYARAKLLTRIKHVSSIRKRLKEREAKDILVVRKLREKVEKLEKALMDATDSRIISLASEEVASGKTAMTLIPYAAGPNLCKSSTEATT